MRHRVAHALVFIAFLVWVASVVTIIHFIEKG